MLVLWGGFLAGVLRLLSFVTKTFLLLRQPASVAAPAEEHSLTRASALVHTSFIVKTWKEGNETLDVPGRKALSLSHLRTQSL